MNPLQIKPNVPVTVALKDLEGTYDPDRETVTYQTGAGQSLTIPRPAVVKLNLLEPQPGEEVVITQIWSGKRWDKSEWTVSLSPRTEKARAKAENEGQDLTEQLQASIEHAQTRRRVVADPTPIRRPARKQPAPEVQPRLFDRGTGTHGPAIQPEDVPRSIPLPAVAIGRSPAQGKIPANIAIKEILAFLKADPSTANWDAQSIQDLASTAYIAAVKQGWIGLWERSTV